VNGQWAMAKYEESAFIDLYSQFTIQCRLLKQFEWLVSSPTAATGAAVRLHQLV